MGADDPGITSPTSDAGKIDWFAMPTPPVGWLKCNGALASRVLYPNLFLAIGTFWGAGDGSTTFGLPEIRGEFTRAWDDGRGIDSGRAFGSAQAADFLAHSHTGATDAQGGHNHQSGVVMTGTIDGNAGYGMAVAGGYANRITIGGFNAALVTSTIGNHSHNVSTNNSGGAETRPRSVALLCCIKY